ncbi:MAG: D-alanyl-D-alanine carboxypeptidase family protein [Clostridia bacterium]|nr:D-alanyl-D-alanine carboxypeptidase family protein [Clostridia bacterium]
MKKFITLLCTFIIVASIATTVAFAENSEGDNVVSEATTQMTTDIVDTTEHSINDSTTEQPATEEPATEEPTTEQPSTEQPSTEEPSTAPVIKPEEPAPVSLTNTSGGILFKWSQVDGAHSYRVYKRGAGERYWTYLGTVAECSFTDPRVASGNYYRYTVIAVNDGGYSTFHSGIVIKRLANPYNIKASNNVDNITLTWAKINGATGYRIYRRTAGVTYWTYLGTYSTTSYVDKNVKENGYYRYTVRAAYGNTFSDYNTNGALTRLLKTPLPKRLVTAKTGVSFSWYSTTTAQSYRVYRRGAGESYWTYLGSTSGNSYFDGNVKPNNYYRYTVRSVSGSYFSGYDSVGITLKYINIDGMIVHGRYDDYLKPGTLTNPTRITVDPAAWELTIVNGGYRISKDYKPDLAYVCGTGERLDKNVAVHYARMYNAAKAQGVYLTPYSGYRSYSTQEAIFDRKVNLYLNQGYGYSKAVEKAATIVMPPGSSEHNLGYAMDIVCVEEWFENTAEFRWLQQNAADYGFVLRYPKDKQHITKVIYEPWHWRYVGVPAAKAMQESGLVLEEYLGVVK